MQSHNKSSMTSDTQADRETYGTDARNTDSAFNDDSTQLDVAIIRQMVLDALNALAASNALIAAGRHVEPGVLWRGP